MYLNYYHGTGDLGQREA